MKRHLPLLLATLLGIAAVLAVLLRLGYPHHGTVAIALYAAGWVCFLVALRRYRPTAAGLDAVDGAVRRRGGLVLAAVGLLALGYLLHVIFPLDQTAFLQLDPAQLRALVDADQAEAVRSGAALEALAAEADRLAPLARKPWGELTAAEREQALGLWSAALDRLIALDLVKERHRYFYQINYLDHPELNLRSFLTADAAFLADYRGALWLRDFVGRNDALATALDEARPALGIPGGLFTRLQQGLTRPETMVLFTAGRAHLEFAKRSGHLTAPADRALLDYCARASREIVDRLGHEPSVFADNPLQLFERTTFRLWFPLQVEVSEAMGDIRTARRGFLITPEQAHAARAKLEPGDIILERRNWYLSNVGLPGFWPHAALYTGDLAELDRYFAGEPALGGLTVSAWLEQNRPEVARDYRGKDADGNERSVLEAVSEGVILHHFEASANADYVALLRPRLPKADKLQALLAAWSYLGRPYDFNFDFVTDNELVCSEVVYKAYRPGPGQRGLHFELERTAGRLVLGPTSIIRKFDAEYDRPDRELDFALFLDGVEAEGRAVERDAATLRASWQRPKWDIAQE